MSHGHEFGADPWAKPQDASLEEFANGFGAEGLLHCSIILRYCAGFFAGVLNRKLTATPKVGDSGNWIISNLRTLSMLGKHNYRRASRTPRWGGSKVVAPQLFVLVAMLLLVIFAMNEAGKPENWEWMGFEEQASTSATDDSDSSQAADEASKLASEVTEKPRFKSSPKQSPARTLGHSGEDASKSDSIELAPDLGSIRASIGNSESNQTAPGSASASEFWRSILGKMKPEQQANFLKMVRAMRHGKTLDPGIVESCVSLVTVVARNRERYHQQLFDQLTLAIEGSDEKKKLASDLFESQKVWEEKILPAFKATVKGEDFTLAQLQAVNRLQAMLDPILFDQVQDKTAIGWAGDAEAWKRIWEVVLGPAGNLIPDEPPPSFKPVTRIELMSQPKCYRGKPVSVQGWVRAARIDRLGEDSELGIPHRYILWMRPKETKQGPYCIYAHELPSGFPELSDQFQDLNENVEIEGYFFKIRTYVAADSSAANSPLIVASKLTRIAPVEHTSVNSWVPSRGLFVALLLVMPILATAIAWWAFRSTKTKPYQPGAKTAGKIDQSLRDLTSDPNVQTDREKVQALYDYDLEGHDSE